MAHAGHYRFDDEDPNEPGTEEKKESAPPPFAAIQQSLFKSRTVLIFGQIDMKLAQGITAQLLALAHESDDPIRVVVNSPGGHVEAGDTIHDMIRFVKAPVKMLGTGWVASAGCHIFLAAKRENRYCLPNTRFLIHQPLGGAGGRATDIAIEAKEIIQMRERLNRIIARETGQPYERVAKDTDRNFWMQAEAAREYGIVTHITEDWSAIY
ncbi:ATP-dependent Clp protease proteolytic subunit [Azospirillum halopraeferens]|uniref:ATP-dependent Clp protease proteolytic subunit n=1 Tax=Azospirillum halopraeferens TaxID=34010 RepID=UPI000419F414|nr:ATP-dependent Clp protease proteolytic subunit [Azospirillum halopraeferens]